MFYTKTLYNYIDIGLLTIKNTDLPMNLSKNTKLTRVKKHRKELGSSISDRLIEIKTPEELFEAHLDQIYKL